VSVVNQKSKTELFLKRLEKEILVLDGAMGSMIFGLGLTEAEVRGERFIDWPHDLKNCTDVFGLTHPEKITELHRQYLEAGADIIETNTFQASLVGLSDFEFPEDIVREINFAGVANARRAADEYTAKTPDQPRFVAGSIGPTSKQTAISTNVEDAAFRNTTFEEMEASYFIQVKALVEAGVDILFPETVIDTLNLKCCSGDGVGDVCGVGVDLCLRPVGGSVLEFCFSFSDDQRRHELRARSGYHEIAY
jgi:5-methyltetrahydrofolate--homocysteine methyltransferase